MEPELVTRQLGLSSIAGHTGFTPCVRKIVDNANRLRFCCLELICFYYTRVGHEADHNVADLDASFVDACFRLLIDDDCSANTFLRATAKEYRNILANEGFNLLREGCLARICQSFRSNIITAISNSVTYTDSVLKAYLCKKYNVGSSTAKLLAARLGSCKAQVLDDAREIYIKKLKADEHRLLELERDAPDEIHALISAQAAARSLPFDDENLRTAFNSAHPFPDGTGWLDRWQTEFDLLPDTDDFSDLFKNRFRMVEEAEKATVSPMAGFGTDFVPFDKETLHMALREMEQGKHGASRDFRAFLRNNPRQDAWGLTVAFRESKLKKLYTHKHIIDGQILTDGVRVIFPLRTHTASQRKSAAGAASGHARSGLGKAELVDQMLDEEDAFAYHAAVGLIDAVGNKKNMQDEKKQMMNLRAEFLAAAKDEKHIRKKKDAEETKKRKREEEAAQRAAKTTEQKAEELRVKKAAKKKKLSDPWEHIQPPAYDKNPLIVGVDTGHVNPVTWASKRYHDETDEHADIGHISLGLWYTKTGQRRRQHVLNKKVKHARLPQLPSAKTVDVAILIETLRARIRNYNRYTTVYGNIAIRRLSFDCYIKKQKTLVEVGKRLMKEPDTILAWGDGDFAHTRKGLSTGVGKTIERFLKTKYPHSIKTTPEHRSSCLCFRCELYTKNLQHGFVKRKNGQFARVNRNPEGAKITKKIHGLLQCTSIACHTRWNRDVNGALNIRKIYISICKTRFPPLHYMRSFTKAALETATNLASGQV